MITKFIEVTNDPDQPEGAAGPEAQGFNWGKFMVGRFDTEEWMRPSMIEITRTGTVRPSGSLLLQRGWDRRHVIVFDLETCEGAAFAPGGLAEADLRKHKIWCCPMFEPFLEWLYKQDLSNLSRLPDKVNLPNAESAMSGHRRPGPERKTKPKRAAPVAAGKE